DGERREEGRRKETERTVERRGAAAVPPARPDVRQEPRPYATARPEPFRPKPRRPAASGRTRPAETYDMRTVCAAGRGVASPEIVSLCRGTYGR
ncbi:hypothetical protein ABZ371_21210, partial [Streptomyces sp. NPDC005899]